MRAVRGTKKLERPIDYSAISKDLAELSTESEKHIEEENKHPHGPVAIQGTTDFKDSAKE